MGAVLPDGMTHHNNDPDDQNSPPDTPPPSTITAADAAPSDDREVIEIDLTDEPAPHPDAEDP